MKAAGRAGLEYDGVERRRERGVRECEAAVRAVAGLARIFDCSLIKMLYSRTSR